MATNGEAIDDLIHVPIVAAYDAIRFFAVSSFGRQVIASVIRESSLARGAMPVGRPIQ